MNAAGSLLGLAIGDAMGAPLEGLPAPRRKVTGMTAGGLHHTRPGEYTDDTLQAVALAESLVACRKFSPEDTLIRLLSAYRAHPDFFGPTSSATFTLLEQGYSADQAALLVHQKNRGSRSNGSIMRGPPLGIFYPPTSVRSVSLLCSKLTHYEPVAGECSAFINQMISRLCRGASRNEAFSCALHQCEDPDLSEILRFYERYPLNPSMDAVATTHAAVTLFMKNDSFADTVISAINLGGDADTIGAICGSLAGALYTLPSI
ncbi:MAG TPA: ADP-ribosylglycohydrolase family protein, partial [Methanomicrobiales archaeon]|nr:ADP-ribosylglycohydrolase family protein [Methanomicrobiales archaeon]